MIILMTVSVMTEITESLEDDILAILQVDANGNIVVERWIKESEFKPIENVLETWLMHVFKAQYVDMFLSSRLYEPCS
jgi:hypothetical protein